ncbi:MAG: hypothetical protein ABI663_03085 [Chryseolinea sp.]
MKFKIAFILTAFMALSCHEKSGNNDSSSSILPIQGTWELISETKIENSDTIFTPASKDQKMIKILNDSHFSFLRHDLNKGKDSTATFVAGGGSYSLKDNQYTEHLDYCNFREWERNSFVFTVAIQNDTLIQSGRERVEGTGIDRIIIEKYFRVKY